MKKVIIFIASLVFVILVFSVIYMTNNKDEVDSGLKDLEDDNYNDAITAFEEALEKDEDNIEVKFALANAYNAIEEIDKAIKLLNEILEDDDKNIETYLLLFDIYSANNQIVKALEIIKSGYDNTESKKLKSMILEIDPYDAPLVSLDEGIYKYGVELQLIADDNLEILYSLDGSKPTIKYEEALILDIGYYTVTLAAVDEDGNQSNTVFYSYTIVDELEASNTSGNLFSGGYVLEAASTIYVVDGEKIMKYEDGKADLILLEGAYASNLNIYGSWIYYQTSEGIFKVKDDGSEQEFVIESYNSKLLTSSVLVMQIKGDHLYFIDPQGYLSKFNLLNKEISIISDLLFVEQYGGQDEPRVEMSRPFYVIDNSIYYVEGLFHNRESQLMSLYKMDLDGSKKTEVVSNLSKMAYDYVTYVLDENYLYYISFDEEARGYYLNKYSLEDQVLLMTERVGEEVSGKVNCVGSLNVKDEIIYYTRNIFIENEEMGPKYTGQLHKMDTRTKEITLLNENDMNYTWGFDFISLPALIAGHSLYYFENNEKIRQDIDYIDLISPGWGK